jgi:hypothetical protein
MGEDDLGTDAAQAVYRAREQVELLGGGVIS